MRLNKRACNLRLYVIEDLMKLRVNGSITEWRDNVTVNELLKELKIEPRGVAVEVNLEIVKKQDYHKRVLKDGDSVEIVNFVGGG